MTFLAAPTVAMAVSLSMAFLPSPRLSEASQQVLCSSDARFTVLTPRVIRAEYRVEGTDFEDSVTEVFLYRGRQSPTPFTVDNTTDWCNITTSALILSFYKPGTAERAEVKHYDWLVQPSDDQCSALLYSGFDASCSGACTRAAKYPQPTTAESMDACCAICEADSDCGAFVYHSEHQVENCFLLAHNTTESRHSTEKTITLGSKVAVPLHPPPSSPSPGPAPAPPNGIEQFAKHLLQARSLTPNGWSWAVTDTADDNLLGTLFPTPSADMAGCCSNPNASAGHYDPKYPLDRGLLSRSGWALIDDSKSPLMNWNATSQHIEDAWISSALRTGNPDLYLFGCGLAYKKCLGDFSSIAGPIAFPPLFGLGVWWSRHWGDESGNKKMVDAVGVMTEQAIITDVLEGYAEHNLPLHVLVLDMEWHEMDTSPECTKFVGKTDWGGYTWNTTLFSDPQAFVAKLHEMRGPTGIRLSLNFHPDSGIDMCQKYHNNMATALGMDPSKPLPDIDGLESLSETYVDAYFKYMIEPTCVDIAWTDTPKATTWTNWLYVRYPMKKGNRTINFSRYGGLGNHRTPTGFSGDTRRAWDTLEYEIFMTPRASNVGFGWWSHDIGGFAGSFVDNDWHTESPELFLRWLQFGALSPIMRTHCRYCDQRVWTWNKYDAPNVSWVNLMSSAMYLRNQLVPYIYTHAALRTHREGQALLVPMYWDEEAAVYPEAYDAQWQQQYFFGQDLLAAPISAATTLNNGRNTTRKQIWLPPSSSGWYDYATMTRVDNDTHGVYTSEFGLDQIPLMVRGGAVLPTRDMRSAYKVVADPLLWVIVPGATSSTGSVYEDDGETMDFRQGLSQTTTLSYVHSSSGVEIQVISQGQTFVTAPKSRDQWIVLRGFAKLPTSVQCNGATVLARGVGDSPGYWVDPTTDSVVVACGNSTSFSEPLSITIKT